MKKRSKRYKDLVKNSKDKSKLKLNDIIERLKKNANSKFEESIDVSVKINIKQSKGGDATIRSILKLPNGTGKKYRIAVLCEPDKVSEAKSSGADVFGSDDLIEKISQGKLDFNKLISTPSMMSKIGKHGKILGPKGLMPNPKLGTVSNNIKKTVNEIKNGLVEIKNDKDGNLASSIGRKNFSSEKIVENFNFFMESLKKEKPSGIKGDFIKNIYLTSTMGLSYKVSSYK